MKPSFALAGLLAVAAAAPAADERPALAHLLAQTGQYVRGFQHDFATVLSDERYVQREVFSQRVSGKNKVSRAQRTMQSEMLFLWLPEERGWLAVRNVVSVDRKPIANSRARLEQWLATSEPGAMGRLRNLRDEGARFNIGHIVRNLSDPTLALKVVDPAYQPRFDFTLAGGELIDGIAVMKLAFTERDQLPTLISVDERTVASSGAIWVTPSGIVLRTRLELNDPESLINVSMSVFYARNAKLGGWLPIRMDEQYSKGGVPIDSRTFAGIAASREDISCSAIYSNYRRFETSARIVPP